MRRRLTLAILGTVAAALLLTGVGTLVLARFGARQSAEEELRNQAESTARLVDLGQTRFSQLSTRDIEAVRAAVCRNGDGTPGATTPASPPGTSAPATPGPTSGSSGTPGTVGAGGDGGAGIPGGGSGNGSDIQRLRAALCSSSPDLGLVAARTRLCDHEPDALDRSMGPTRRAARDQFCRAPSDATLDGVRDAFCPTDPGATTAPTERAGGPAARARAEQLRLNLCRAIDNRGQPQKNLQSALSKEQIELVVFGPDDTVQIGELPSGLVAADLHPERLRNGESVSGQLGAGVFAVAAVDPTADDLAAIVISRPSDPVRGLIPWFLLASGVTLLIGLLVAEGLARKLTHPLREARTVTTQIAAGDLSVRVPEHPVRPGQARDELDELAHAINTMAEALERSRGLERQFLLSVSHDLRTPLTSIRGYAEAIADGAAPDPQRAAGVILAESRRLERLVKDLLDLAKLDARRFQFTIVQVDLNEVASDSVEGFRREVEAAGLRIELEEPATPTPAYVDPDRLQQVIANLVENALKFATATITVRVATDTEGPRIEVIDDGPGIAPEDLPHVFERLYVTAARPQRKEVGSGLGLAIVREVTETMGGTVRAEAAPGAGTTIVVHLATTPAPTPVNPDVPTADLHRP